MNKKGKAYTVLAYLFHNFSALYYDPIDKFGSTTAKAMIEVLTCTAKDVTEDFSVTTIKYAAKELCSE
jgi:hypothetical protein